MAALCAISLFPSAAHAVVVFVRGSNEPIAGYLVSRSEQSIVLDEPQPDGSMRRRELPMASVEDVIAAVDPARLEALSPDRPQGYRNYAEELAEKKADPEARDTAIRLFLIAAHLAPDDLGRSSLLAMAALARTPEEERKFRAMAFLLDPGHDPRLLRSSAAPPSAAAPSARGGEGKSLLEVVRAIRRRESAVASRMLQRPEVVQEAGKHRDLMSHQELERANLTSCDKCQQGKVTCPACGGKGDQGQRECPVCRGRGTVSCSECGGDYLFEAPPLDLLQRLLRLEMRLSASADGQSGATPTASQPAGRSWSEILAHGPPPAVASLSLETLTRFDPRKSVYRNGAWVEPGAAP